MDGALFAGSDMFRSAWVVFAVALLFVCPAISQPALAQSTPAAREKASPAQVRRTEDSLKDRNLRGQVRLAAGLDPVNDQTVIWSLRRAGIDGQAGAWTQTEYGPQFAIAAPPGRYLVAVTYGNVSRSIPVTVEARKPASLDVVLDAGRVTGDGAIAGSASPLRDVSWELKRADGESVTTSYDTAPHFILPAGSYVLKLSKGTASTAKAFDVSAGSDTKQTLTLEVGRLIVSGAYVEGGPPLKETLTAEVRQPPAVDGEVGETVSTNYGAGINFDLAPGPYDVVVSVGKASVLQRVEVTSGRAERVAVALNAGVVGIQAPTSAAIEIYGAERDINNQRQLIEAGYDGVVNLALPAGDYVAVAAFEGNMIEKAFTIKAGKRTEVEIKPAEQADTDAKP